MKTKQILISLFVTTLLVACNAEPRTLPTFEVADTPTEPSPSKVHVVSDGSGDYVDLVLAVESVAAESTIVLGEGNFQLEGPWDIDKPLTLEGAGSDKTVVVGEGPKYVAQYSGEGLLTIRGITFRREGDYAAAVMIIQGGEIDFSNCRFSNGANGEEDAIGVGLILLNDTTGVVEKCEFNENAGSGITVLEQATPKLVGNNIYDNGGIGIYFQIDEDGGLASRNILNKNNNNWGDFGTDIIVFGSFAPDLVSNTCSKEGFPDISPLVDHSGIVFVSRSDLPAADRIEGNDCAVAWCDTPTGSLLSMTCRDQR